MNGLPLLMVVAAVGVDYGWMPSDTTNPNPRELEYIVQLSPQELTALTSGPNEAYSNIPKELQGRIVKVTVRVGTEKLPQDPPLDKLALLGPANLSIQNAGGNNQSSPIMPNRPDTFGETAGAVSQIDPPASTSLADGSTMPPGDSTTLPNASTPIVPSNSTPTTPAPLGSRFSDGALANAGQNGPSIGNPAQGNAAQGAREFALGSNIPNFPALGGNTGNAADSLRSNPSTPAVDPRTILPPTNNGNDDRFAGANGGRPVVDTFGNPNPGGSNLNPGFNPGFNVANGGRGNAVGGQPVGFSNNGQAAGDRFQQLPPPPNEGNNGGRWIPNAAQFQPPVEQDNRIARPTTTPPRKEIEAEEESPSGRLNAGVGGGTDTEASLKPRSPLGWENVLQVLFLLSVVVNFYLGVLIHKLLTRYRTLLASVRAQGPEPAMG